MKQSRLILTIAFILIVFNAYAIRPVKEYSRTPDAIGISCEELKVKTSDGYAINVWHYPVEESTPIIIACSDAGNMSDWMTLAAYLQYNGMDVWTFDYRGFGDSDDFPIIRSQLFHTEFVKDLSAVVDYVCDKTSEIPMLMGISMGSIIVNEYLKNNERKIVNLIYDGYVCNPSVWIGRLKEKGKEVSLPKGYDATTYDNKGCHILYIIAEKDTFSLMSDIPHQDSADTRIKSFDCEHIMSFFKFPKEYIKELITFIDSYDD